MKTILKCIITTHEGRIFNNPLKLSETHLLSKILKENKTVQISRVEITKEHFKTLFG